MAVTQRVAVTLDASKFDEAFLQEFREGFYPFVTVERHAEHIAQLAARQVYDLSPRFPREFVEGYGEIGPMGISANVLDCEMEVEPSDA